MMPSLLSSVTIAVVLFQCARGIADEKADSRAAALFKQAEKLLKDKKYDDALKVVFRGISLEPRNPNGYLIRGRIRSRRTMTNMILVQVNHHIYEGRSLSTEDCQTIRDALLDFQRAKSLGARKDEIHHEIGSCYLRLFNAEKAAESFTKSLQVDRNHELALVLRAKCFLAQNNFVSARQDLNRVLKLQPKNTAALNLRAICHLNMSARDAAYTDYTRMIQVDPRNSIAWLGRGAMQARRAEDEGKPELLAPAIRDLKKAVELRPKYGLGYATLAVALDQKGDTSKAIAVLAMGIRKATHCIAILRYRGYLFSKMGQYKAAVAEIDKVLRQASTVREKAKCYKQRGGIYLQLGNKERARLDAARGQWYADLWNLNVKLTRNPDDSQSRLARAKHFHANGQSKQAIADFTAVLKSNPKSNAAFVGRAKSLLVAGESSRALTDCDAALKLNPKDREAISTRADALLAKGDYSKAIADYQRINAFGGNFARAYWLRANAHKKAGRTREAAADYRRAAAMDPSLKRR